MSKKIVAPILTGLCALLLAGPAQAADACSKLAGSRWVGYMEGAFSSSGGSTGVANTLGVSHMDFRTGVVGGITHSLLTSPKVTAVDNQSKIAGQGTADKVIACAPADANPSASTAKLGFVSGGAIQVTLASDGLSMTTKGLDANSKFMTGWAARAR